MTQTPATCEPTTSLRLVAQMMADHDCSAIPVTRSGKLVGIITDRDITTRGVAVRNDAPLLPASACMSQPVIAVGPDDALEKVIALMEENVIHHIPVIGPDGSLAGMIAQSDIGRRLTNREFGALARMTSIHSRYSRRFTSALVKSEH